MIKPDNNQTTATSDVSENLEAESFKRMGGDLSAKIEQTEEILGVSELDPDFIEALAVNSEQTFVRSSLRESVSTEQLWQILDAGIIGQGLPENVLKTTNIDAKNSGIAGLDPSMDDKVIYKYVNQDSGRSARDMPLASSGFAACHAALIYDPETSSTALFHIVDLDYNEKILKTAKALLSENENREAILVYGTESRRDHNNDFAHALGIENVRSYSIPTGSYHWAIQYDPESNTITVGRSNSTVQLPGFSSSLQTTPVGEFSNERARAALSKAFRDAELKDVHGFLDEKQFSHFHRNFCELSKWEASQADVRKWLIQQELGGTLNNQMFIPGSLKHLKIEETPADLQEVYSIGERMGEIHFNSFEEANEFRYQLIVGLKEHFQNGHMYSALFEIEGEKVGVCGGASNTVTLRPFEGPESKAYHHVLQQAAQLQSTQDYKVRFDSGLNGASFSGRVRVPSEATLELWREEQEWNKRKRR